MKLAPKQQNSQQQNSQQQNSQQQSNEIMLSENIVDEMIASTFNNFLVDLISGNVAKHTHVENVLATTIGLLF